jgi:CRISPR-associated endoribonuclease Cas6
MVKSLLYSIILELCAVNTTPIPAHRGDHTHALFLDLVRQVDAKLSSRLHDEPEYRPFTVSVLQDARVSDGMQLLQAGQVYRLRLTLLDGGGLWQRLSAHFLEASSLTLRLDKAQLQLTRVISTPRADATGWAGYADWQTLAATLPRNFITMRFASPCAFSMGDRRFALFPEPLLLWDSLVRSWNRYAPAVLQIDKVALRDFVTQQVMISDYDLHTARAFFATHAQKGFMGSCTYQVKSNKGCAPQVAALAEFARYAGVGSKTTSGMGQARLEQAEDSICYNER